MIFPDLALAQRLEQKETANIKNIVASFVRLFTEKASGLDLPDGGYACFTGSKQPINRAFNLGMQAPVQAATLEQIEQFFQIHQLPSEIELCPLADASLLKLLADRNYRPSRFINVFYRDLSDYPHTAQFDPNVEVRPAQSHEAELWAKTLASGFTHTGETTNPNLLILMEAMFVRTDVIPFLAWFEGEIAGGGLLTMEEGVAGLSTATTLPHLRERGVQAALLQARLTVAKQADCDLATIHAIPGTASQRNIQRAGFQVAYTNIVVSRAYNQ